MSTLKEDMEELKKHAGDLTDDQKIELLKGLQAAGQKWLSDDEFNEQFERGIAMVKDKNDDELLMQFWLYGRDYDAEKEEDQWAVMPIGIADWPLEGMTKQQAMEALGVLFASNFPEHMLVNIVHTSEAWMARHDKDDDLDKAPMPSKDPNRIEVVLVTATSLDRRLSQYFAEIQRDENGKFTGLKEDPDMTHRHDPEKPTDPRMQRDYLSEYIYNGYNTLREKERAAKAKKSEEGKSDGKTG